MPDSSTILERIQSDQDLAGDLIWPFDFEVIPPETSSDWFSIREEIPTTIIAQDGTGARFCLLEQGEKELVLYVGSEGDTGVMGESLEDFLGIILACPYWSDAASQAGQLEEDDLEEQGQQWYDEFKEDCPELDEIAASVAEILSININPQPLKSLMQRLYKYRGKIKVSDDEGISFEYFGT